MTTTTDFDRELKADRRRESRHSTKKIVMGAFLAVLVAGGAYVLFSSQTPKEQAAQSEMPAITAPAFTPSSVPPPTALPPMPIPQAVPMPKATAPAAPSEVTPAPLAPLSSTTLTSGDAGAPIPNQ